MNKLIKLTSTKPGADHLVKLNHVYCLCSQTVSSVRALSLTIESSHSHMLDAKLDVVVFTAPAPKAVRVSVGLSVLARCDGDHSSELGSVIAFILKFVDGYSRKKRKRR